MKHSFFALSLCSLFLFSIAGPVRASEDVCEEKPHSLTAEERALVAEVAKSNNIAEVSLNRTVRRQYEIVVDLVNGAPQFTLNTSAGPRSLAAQRVALTKLLKRIEVPDDGRGGDTTSLWIVQYHGTSPDEEWGLDYTCFSPSDESGVQDDRSDGKDTGPTPPPARKASEATSN